MTCVYSTCGQPIQDCDALGQREPWEIGSEAKCRSYPGSDLAWAAWHLAKNAAVCSWLSAGHLPAPWAARDVAKMDREMIAHASAAEWLREQGERRCSPASTPFFDKAGRFFLVFHDDLGPLWCESEACP